MAKENTYLYINTVGPEKITICLFSKNRILQEISRPIDFNQNQPILELIDQILKKNRVNLKKITGIAVTNGPGRFSSIRTGLSIANTLAYVLKIPIIGLSTGDFKSNKKYIRKLIEQISKRKIGDLVLPFYGKKPNITTQKVHKQL